MAIPSPFADHDHISAKAQVVKELGGRNDNDARARNNWIRRFALNDEDVKKRGENETY